MASTEWIIDGLPDETQQLLRTYVKDVRGVYGEQLDSLVLYGSAVRGDFLPGRSNLNLLLCLPVCDVAALQKYNSVHKRWGKEQIVVPLFMTLGDLRSASSVFPLEWLDIQESHRVLWGQGPFVGFKVEMRHLAVEVMQSLRGNLFRVRQRLVEGGGTEEAAAVLLPLSITALLPALRGVQRLLEQPVPSQGDVMLKEFESHLGVDCSGLRDAWLLKRGQITPGQKEVPRLMERYLESLQRVIDKVDASLSLGQR